jgi:NAD(P)-dependent dehydrogenase (short-subunit alcohol dehydrogenase family)
MFVFGVSSGDGAASVEAFDKQMAVNARSVMLCYQHAARQMISQGRGGRIIGMPGRPFYLCTSAR